MAVMLEDIVRGTEEIIPIEDFKKQLESGKTLKIKFGADPTAPDLHLGHTVVLRKLRKFQEMGHKIQLIIGDFTARLGDPSGKSVTRPPLTKEEVLKNAETYKSQVFKILKQDESVEIFYNSEWLETMQFDDVIKLCSKYTVARMLERDDFNKRYTTGQSISVHEFLYPLIQGYDSVALKDDIEIGGTDQKFNLLVGRDLQKEHGQKPQIIITMPILPGTDGVKKMSKSYGNYIALNDSSKDMFGKIMSISDELMFDYFKLLTDVPETELNEYKKQISENGLNPRDLKEKLAKLIVADYYGNETAQYEADEFKNVFSKKLDPDNAPEITVSENLLDGGKISAIEMVKLTNALNSNAEIKRLFKQGGIKYDNKTVSDMNQPLEPVSGNVLKIGKHNFFKIK
jgi:tyrosyl-tRNA synthetase